MNDQTDSQLLRAYAEDRSEPAFTELVRRHVDFVYSAALRMVCDSHLAQDVTQGVFAALAKNAAQLGDRPVLSGWLHRTTQNIAAQTVCTDVRRRVREQEAAAMNELLSAEPDPDWENISPHLDAALGELSEPDRDALLLRCFERKSAREIAQTLGVSDEAAQKRVNRAVERLREFFAKRGVTVAASGLVVVISTNAVQAAPVGLTVTISTAAAFAGTTLTTATATAAKVIAMTTLQKTLVAVTLVAGLATPLAIQHRAQVNLREENHSLRQQASEVTSLRVENERLAELQADADELARLRKDQAELLRLRGEVGRLRQEASELETLRKQNSQLRASLAEGRATQPGPQGSNDVASAKSVIFNPAASVAEKLEALRLLRSANARDDDVTKQMVQAYYATDNPEWRADIFRQLSGVITPGLKQPLLEAVGNANDNTNVRQEAAETLAHYLPDPDVKSWLDHLAANDPDLEVRIQATKSLQADQRKQRK